MTAPFINYSRDDLIFNLWGVLATTIERHPDKPFFVTTSGKITYSDAGRYSDIVCFALQQMVNVPKGGVGIFTANPLTLVPLQLGTIKAGRYYVPLDTAFPSETLKRSAELAEIQIIATDADNLGAARAVFGDRFPILNFDSLDLDEEPEITPYAYDPDDCSQVMFTSGSTGEAKGVIQTFASNMNSIYVRYFAGLHDRDETARVLSLSRYTFAGFANMFYGGLALGYSVHAFDVKADGFAPLSAFIREQEVTEYTSMGTVFRSWVSTLSAEDVFPSVLSASAGGEKRLVQDVETMRRIFPNLEFTRAAFGSTETHSVTRKAYPADQDLSNVDRLSDGKPVDGVTIHIWDDEGQAVPQGEVGELVVYSRYLSRGYINNPDLTRERYLPDPDNPGYQYYKTGDLAKINAEGELVHMGRKDNMVKLKGVRIELATVEMHLIAYPAVVHAACNVHVDQNGNQKLIAYIQAESGMQVPVSDLRTFMARRLPLHWLPHYYVQMDELPQTRTGKLDRNRLPAPELVRPALANPYVPPANELETQLAGIWEELIGVTGIGVTDDFFEVGGDSLLGVLLFIQIEKQLGLNLPVSVLLTASTIREQAAIIEDPVQATLDQPVITIRGAGSRVPVVFIPGRGGYPTRIRHLARVVDPETPVFALQDISEHRAPARMRRVESVAAYYINELRKQVPHGPYALIGESMGGKVAYEMARQLAELGEAVAFVGLLDTYNLDEDNYVNDTVPYYWLMLKKHASILLESDWPGRWEYLDFYRKTAMQKVREEIRFRLGNGASANGSALPENVQATERANRRASQQYQPASHDGRVVLFKALRGPHSDQQMNGWDAVDIRELIVHELDCYHGSILFQPAVSELGRLIDTYTTTKGRQEMPA